MVPVVLLLVNLYAKKLPCTELLLRELLMEPAAVEVRPFDAEPGVSAAGLVKDFSNLIAMTFNLIALASTLVAMAFRPNSNGLQAGVSLSFSPDSTGPSLHR